MLGPIDYIVVGFEGNNFDGSILNALSEAAENGTIRVIDLLLVVKDVDGTITMAETEDQDDELKEVAKALGHEGDMPLLTEDDVNKIGKSMRTNTSAGILVIEQLWAKDLKKALIDRGATLLDEGRIHPDKISDAVEEIKQDSNKVKV